jgi:uncharacterized protein
MRSRTGPRRLSLPEARRLVLLAQGLGGPRWDGVVETVERLGRLQVDPTRILERAERLTVWSRIGSYEREELRRALEEEPVALFEYVSFILPVADLPLHRPALDRFPRPEYTRGRYMAEWLADNAGFRAYVLEELERRGPMRSRDFDDRAEVPWQTGGWNDGRNVGRMLEALWRGGNIAIRRREGSERVWDLFDRVLPAEEMETLPDEVVAIELMERQLRAGGLVRPGWGSALDYRLPARDLGEATLRADGTAMPVSVEGLEGEWLAHAEGLAALDDGAWQPRTTLLGPFDAFVADRERLAELFGFAYRLELYLPAARREYGPYALTILDGDRPIGRLDAVLDRRAGILRLRGVWAEADAPADATDRLAAAIGALATWLGAASVEPPPRLPAPFSGLAAALA